MKISWKRWKLGVIIAVGLSALVATAGLTTGTHWKTWLATFAVALITHFGAFQTQHPLESIELDTATTPKPPASDNQTKP